MRKVIALLLLLSLSYQAQAYDEDTHFYATYAMARYAGINHDVAARIALSAQWMDESFISDPIAVPWILVSGVRKRRLLHFPADRYVGKFNALAQQNTYGLSFDDLPPVARSLLIDIMRKIGFSPARLARMNLITETEKDHRLATQLLLMGLKNGNLMQAAASLHVLQDSYAHAGFPAGDGHRGGWHWPDRPYSNPNKYFQMTESVFQALAAIRLMLPPSALECSLQTTGSGAPNCATGAPELQVAYASNADVQEQVSYVALKDPEYVRKTMKSVLTLAADKGIKYLNLNSEQIDDLIAQTKIDGSKDAYQTLFDVITALTERYMQKRNMENPDHSVNVRRMIGDVFQIKNPTEEVIARFIRNYGIEEGLLVRTDSAAFKKFAMHLSRGLLRWYVPRDMNNDDHRAESELDRDIVRGSTVIRSPRNIEMEIRVRRMQGLIKRMYGIEIEMIPNNTKDDKGFAHEIWMLEDAQPKPVKRQRPGVTYVTFNLQEKNQWDHMIFKYMFPSLKEQDLVTMVNAGAKLKLLVAKAGRVFSDPEKSNTIDNADEEDEDADDKSDKESVMENLAEAAFVFSGYKELAEITENLMPFAKAWFKDLTHELNTQDNHNYHSVNFLADFKRDGVIHPFLTNKDVWNTQMVVNRPRTMHAQVPSSVLQ